MGDTSRMGGPHPVRRPSRFGVVTGAVTVALFLLLGPGAAALAEASGLTIGAGSMVQLGNAVLALGCNDLHIEPAGTLDAQASTIELAGNCNNRGTFDPGTGTVRVEDGCALPETSVIGGSNTFFDLVVATSAGKTVRFPAGATQTILDHLTLMGALGNLLKIRSTVAGGQTFMDLAPTGPQQIDYVDVADTGATGRPFAPGPPS
jgi:hypothetical protein